VRSIRQKDQSGQKLTVEEGKYYERAKAARRKGAEPGKAAPAKTAVAVAGDSGKTSTGLTPLCDMKADQKYKGEDGGLYGGGSNTPPPGHLKAALEAASRVRPLDESGKPSASGKIVLLTHGMSNTTNESQQFIKVANADARKNPNVVIVDGAQGGIDSRQWVSGRENRKGAAPWQTLEQRIKAAGVTAEQAQVVWMKHAVARPAPFGEFPKHAETLKIDMAQIVRMLKQKYPNLQLVYVSSRTYAGYATTELNPEPYAYESAFAVRWLIQDQMKGETKAPTVLWGPYLWSDGEKGRQAGDLAYQRSDFRDDGTHPSDSGRQKVAEQLVKFFSSDPTSKDWYLKNE